MKTNTWHKNKLLAVTIIFALAIFSAGILAFGAGGKTAQTAFADEIPTTSWTAAGNYASDYESGTGASDNPYIIANAAQLAKLMKDSCEAEIVLNTYFKMVLEDGATELDMTEHLFEPIGLDATSRFRGNFDGNGCTVNLIIKKDTAYAGFFGYTVNATMKNLTVKGSVSGTTHVGGIVGYGSGANIENCINLADIRSSGSTAGGIAGQCGGTVKNCINLGDITSSVNNAGGIVGNATGATMESCINAGAVTATGNYVGGIVGTFTGSPTIKNCFNTGNISGSVRVGGISASITPGSGTQTANIENCYNTGAVTATGDYAAGLVAYIAGSTMTVNMKNCYSIGTVSSGESAFYVGGLVGVDTGSTTNYTYCYYDTTVIGDFEPGVGRVKPGFARGLNSVGSGGLATGTNPAGLSDLTTDKMTGTGAIGAATMNFAAADWAVTANTSGYLYYPQLKALVEMGGEFERLSLESVTIDIRPIAETPVAPTVSGTPTATSITLTAITGAEYSKDNGANWQDSPTFDGLTANTDYTFVARIKETVDERASAASAVLTIKTAKNTPAAPAAPTVNGTPTATSITLTTIAGAEYSKDNGVSWQDSPTFDGLTANTDYTFIARIKETSEANASLNSAASATIKTAKNTPAAPAAPTVSGTPTATSITLTAIAGAEYSKDNGVSWQDSPTFDGLTANTEYTFIARLKATADENASPAGAQAKIKTAEEPGGEPDKDGLSGGAIAGIVIGSVAVAGIGGFAIFWFVAKKRTFAQLGESIKGLWGKFTGLFKKKAA